MEKAALWTQFRQKPCWAVLTGLFRFTTNVYNSYNKTDFHSGEKKPQFLKVANQKLRLLGSNSSGRSSARFLSSPRPQRCGRFPRGSDSGSPETPPAGAWPGSPVTAARPLNRPQPDRIRNQRRGPRLRRRGRQAPTSGCPHFSKRGHPAGSLSPQWPLALGPSSRVHSSTFGGACHPFPEERPQGPRRGHAAALRTCAGARSHQGASGAPPRWARASTGRPALGPRKPSPVLQRQLRPLGDLPSRPHPRRPGDLRAERAVLPAGGFRGPPSSPSPGERISASAPSPAPVLGPGKEARPPPRRTGTLSRQSRGQRPAHFGIRTGLSQARGHT